MIVLTLPKPPSVNHLYANRRGGKGPGRYPTEKYVAWQRVAGWELRRQHPPTVTGEYNIMIEVQRNLQRRADCQNYIKAVSDLLVKHRVVVDDHLEQEVIARWADVEGCRVTLTPVEAA